MHFRFWCNALPSPLDAAAETMVVGTNPTHEGEKPPKEWASEDMDQTRLRYGKKVYPPGDEKTSQNDAAMTEKEEKNPFTSSHKNPPFLFFYPTRWLAKSSRGTTVKQLQEHKNKTTAREEAHL